MGETKSGVGNSDTEFRSSITTGTHVWRKVGAVVGDRRISSTLKGTVLTSRVTPVYVYDLETMALTGKQQDKVQVS